MTLHFFIGKGGVGKSTVSALSALSCARGGEHALLVSMDPAHNQQDIFRVSLKDRPRQVRPCLRVSQVDTAYWVDRYLKETRQAIQRAYSYQGAYNLTHTFDILRLSPGLEAFGLVLAFNQVVRQEEQADSLFFDMPPTAQTLDFLTLPDTTLAWLEALHRLRGSIRAKKQIVSRIKNNGQIMDLDPINTKLSKMIARHEDQKACLIQARIHLVTTAEPLSLAEAARFQARLKALGYTVSSLILNKARPEDIPQLKAWGLDAPLIQVVPTSQWGLTGLAALDNYLTGVWQPAFGPMEEEGPGMPWGRVLGA